MGGGVEGQEVRDLPPSKTRFVIQVFLGHFIGLAGWLFECSVLLNIPRYAPYLPCLTFTYLSSLLHVRRLYVRLYLISHNNKMNTASLTPCHLHVELGLCRRLGVLGY